MYDVISGLLQQLSWQCITTVVWWRSRCYVTGSMGWRGEHTHP